MAALDWADRGTWPAAAGGAGAWGGGHARFDVVMGSDLVYDDAMAGLLGAAVEGLLKPGGHLVYVAPPSGRAGLARFLDEELPRRGLVRLASASSPRAYGANPLASGDATTAFLHFAELGLPYVLHVFQQGLPPPPGHTPFSWMPRPLVPGAAKRPPGHTPFSWPGV